MSEWESKANWKDPNWKYKHWYETDIRETIARVKRETKVYLNCKKIHWSSICSKIPSTWRVVV